MTLPITTTALLEHTAEESCELAQACLKLSRHRRGENPTGAEEEELTERVLEEIADVLNMLNVLKKTDIWDNAKIADYMVSKMDRWQKRLGQKGMK